MELNVESVVVVSMQDVPVAMRAVVDSVSIAPDSVEEELVTRSKAASSGAKEADSSILAAVDPDQDPGTMTERSTTP